MRKTFIFSCLLIITLFMISCKKETTPFSTDSIEAVSNNQIFVQDSKFIDDAILTTVDSNVAFLDKALNIINQTKIKANWLDCIKHEDKYYIISGNFQNETDISIFDLEFNLISTNVLLNTSLLAIDQTIFYYDNYFYFTITTIDGVVNNTNPDIENGLYTVKLYKTLDFTNTTFVMDVVSMHNNLEDIKLFTINDKMAMIYEKETLHRKNSSIEIVYTTDTLFDTTISLVSDGDDEPGNFLIIDGYYYLFYATDINHPNTSYDGSNVYYIKFDSSFKQVEKKMMNSKYSSIHLYDVLYSNGSIELLYVINYDTLRTLIVEKF